jgi:hypothetical protein
MRHPMTAYAAPRTTRSELRADRHLLYDTCVFMTSRSSVVA